jgi:hypothetical protein
MLPGDFFGDLMVKYTWEPCDYLRRIWVEGIYGAAQITEFGFEKTVASARASINFS